MAEKSWYKSFGVQGGMGGIALGAFMLFPIITKLATGETLSPEDSQTVVEALGAIVAGVMALYGRLAAKTAIKLTIAFLMVLNMPGTAYAYQQRLHFTWEYPAAPVDLAGFKIYQDSVLIATISDTTAREYIAPVEVTGSAQAYTITAYDKGGSESPKSAPLPFDPPPGGVSGFTVSTGGK